MRNFGFRNSKHAVPCLLSGGFSLCLATGVLYSRVYPWRSSLSWHLRKAGASSNYSLHLGSEWVLGFALTHVNEAVLINLILEQLISKELFTAGC